MLHLLPFTLATHGFVVLYVGFDIIKSSVTAHGCPHTDPYDVNQWKQFVRDTVT